MASAKDFCRLEQINGVSNYILVRGDGQIISQNMENAASFAPIITNGGTQCDTLSTDMGGNRYIHLCIERESGNDLLIFSLGRYYLGIFKHPESERQEIIDNVIYFLKNLS
jgi:hypothetical protein